MAGETEGPSKAEVISHALDAHALKLRRFVDGRVPTPYVEDVLQTAAVRAVERSESLNDSGRVLPWLYRIHRNVIADILRKHASRERMLERSAMPLDAMPPDVAEIVAEDASCDCSLVQAGRLNPDYAAVLKLVDAGDASLADAARVLGISVNNATVRLHRARKALRSSMLDHCGVQNARDCIDCRCVFDGCCVS